MEGDFCFKSSLSLAFEKALQSINRMHNCSANGFTLYASLDLHVSSLGLVNNPNNSSKYSLWEFLLSISNRMP